MAELTGKAISELPESTTVNNAALVALSENGVSKKMTLATLVGNLLKKTGDTMTGDLNLKSTSDTIGVIPSTTHVDRKVLLQDLAGTILGRFQSVFYTDGRVGIQFMAQRSVSGSTIQNIIELAVGSDGTRMVGVSETAPWRKTLGLCYAANDTFTNNNTIANGFISSSTTEVQFVVHTPLSMENISTVTVTSLNGIMRGGNGYLNSTTGNTNFATASGYTVTAYKQSNTEVRVLVKKSSVYTNVDNNTPISYVGNITLKFT